jgi:hypothetical protein
MILEKPSGVNVRAGRRKLVKYLKTTGQYPDIFRYIVFHMLQFNEDDRYTFAQVLDLLETAQNIKPSTCIFDPTVPTADYPTSNHPTIQVDTQHIVMEIRMEYTDTPRP